MDMKKKINMSMIFIFIQIQFDINMNNDELLKIIWEHYKKKREKKNWSSLLVCSNVEPKLLIINLFP
jgi:hypothetical protein